MKKQTNKRFMTHQEVIRYNHSVRHGTQVFKAKIPMKNIIIGSCLIASSFIIPDLGIGMILGICIMSSPNMKQGIKDGMFFAKKTIKKIARFKR